MAAIDSLCVLVEIGTENRIATAYDPTRTFTFIKRVVRSYESRDRAEEDLELLNIAANSKPGFGPAAHYRIDDITHIER